MRKTNFLAIVVFVAMMLSVIGCQKKVESSAGRAETAMFENKDSLVSKNLNTTILKLLGEIPDKDAAAFYGKYVEMFKVLPTPTKGGKYPDYFPIKSSFVEEIKKIEKDSIRLIFTDNNGRLDILFAASDGKKYEITDTLSTNIKEVKDFKDWNDRFQKGIYVAMNDAKRKVVSSIGGNNSYKNTTEVVIPRKSFDKYDPTKHNSVMVLIPGIITKNSYNSKKQNKKGHLTLILSLPDTNLKAKKAAWLVPPVYEDHFCLMPPGC